MTATISLLMAKGVIIPDPQSVYIAEDVDPERISGDGVVLHPGCRILGKSTWISRGAILGEEGAVTVSNCRIGPEARLKGGFFQEAVFLKKSSMGSGAHVREGTILEEEASGAHTVGLKQTILFPYVTLGSLINFCDCFMAGGTDRKNHSEVGSSYIHFNFTPNQDKATASLMGDVPQGVMLDQPPIFLGGQGGLVGPCRLAFGTVVAAGSICRKDELRPSRLIAEGAGKGINIAYGAGSYRAVKRIVVNNLIYIGNLVALKQWYRHVRALFLSNEFPEALLEGLLEQTDRGITERIARLKGLAANIAAADAKGAEDGPLRPAPPFVRAWPKLEEVLTACQGEDVPAPELARFLEIISARIQVHGQEYLSVIKSLEPEGKLLGTGILQAVADRVRDRAMLLLPEFQ